MYEYMLFCCRILKKKKKVRYATFCLANFQISLGQHLKVCAFKYFLEMNYSCKVFLKERL